MSVGPGEPEELGACGLRTPAAATVQRTDVLSVPHRKRMSHAYVTSEDGVRELCIYYGSKEVSFDEERLFPFGEQLVNQVSFVAESATAWGPGYAWDEVRPLFEALVAEGIVRLGDDVEDPRGGGLVPSLLPPSACPAPRAWSVADCESITQDLAGRPVEIGYLEAILSVYRIAHPALDTDNRQVGEANVFPPALRLDRDTEWRVCQYAGSRYRDDAPMNVTALKAMIKYWKPMMAAILEVRAEVQRRIARARDGWTVGDMHLLSGVVLSLPGFQLMTRAGAPPQPVHPVLSSLFRITDGIRMTTHEMLFLSAERTRLPEEPITAQELYAFAERNGILLSGTGVCAGPKAMIDEFLNTVFTGDPVERSEGIVQSPDVRALLDQVPDAVDYAFLGLQSWSVSRSIWLAMSRAYKALRGLLGAAADDAGVVERLRAHLDEDWAKLDVQRIASDYEHDVHVQVYADTYEQSWRGLRTPLGPARLADRIAPVPEGPGHAAAARTLREILSRRFSGMGAQATRVVDPMVDTLVLYLREEQAILAATTELQAAINALLDRPAPRRPLTARDVRVTFAMYGGSIAKFPYLFDTLEHQLGLRVACTAGTIEASDA